jgi:ABC-type lipoprotein export system ATPase subunit
MKIVSLELSNYHPIKNIKLENLGNTVIIAGANGSGKTRLKQAIVDTLKGTPLMDMTLAATRKEEEDPKYFNGKNLSVIKGTKNPGLNNYITSRKYGVGAYVGSLVQIDSNRSVQTLKYTAVNWLGADPDDAETATNYYFNPFPNRWQDFMNYIHQKTASRDKKLADELKKNPKNGEGIIKAHPDPLDKYKKAFTDLLPGKTLTEIDPAAPREFYFSDSSGAILPFSALSSGEQEVVKVVFDVIRKEIKHSVVIVDEPELHLHPTLTFKLVETLKAIGDHTNQFIFLTHSADLISTYYSTGDVYFIDALQSGANQAHRLSDLNHSHGAVVQLVGQNLGLFAVGKKLVFVEGQNSSVDRLTYHLIAQTILPDAKIIPIGSVKNIFTLNIVEEQIRNAIFGVNIFMIRDRDGLDEVQISSLEKTGRVRCLRKRHIENYFLDHEILFEVAEKLYLTSTNPELSASYLQGEIERIAKESVNFNLLKNTREYLTLNYFFKIPTVKSVDTKSIDEIKNDLIVGAEKSIKALVKGPKNIDLKQWIDLEEKRLNEILKTEAWKDEFQGKQIFTILCADVLKEDQLRIRQAYVDIALSQKPEVFKDIIDIFRSF